VGYDVGIDLGVASVAAAAMRDRRVTLVPLTDEAPLLSPNLLVEGDTVTVGVRESEVVDPDRFVTELVADLGVTDALDVAGRRWSVIDLTAIVIRHVLDRVRAAQGPDVDSVVVAHPAGWGPERVAALAEATRRAGAPAVTTVSALEAVAVRAATALELDDGDRVLVADYGGGGFQAAVLERVGTRFATVGRPVAVDRVGGIDVDDAVLAHVMRALGEAFARLDPGEPADRRAVAALCERCVDAKERLRELDAVEIDVSLRGTRSLVRLDGERLDELAAPVVRRTLGPLRDLLTATGTDVTELRVVQLVGGGSMLAIVPDLVEGALGVPVTVDPYPQWSAALGSAISSALEPPPTPARDGDRDDVDAGGHPELVPDGVDDRLLGLPDVGTATAVAAPAPPTAATGATDDAAAARPTLAKGAPPSDAPRRRPDLGPGAGPAASAAPGVDEDDVDTFYPERRLVRILWLFLGFLLVVAAAVGALILLERDSDDDPAPPPTTASTAAGDVTATTTPTTVAGASVDLGATALDAARERVAALTGPVDDLGITEQLPAGAAPARLAFLRLDQGDGPVLEPDVVAAAALLGLETTVVDLGSSAESASAAWQETADALPDAVVAGGVPLALVETPFATLVANGVPVVVWASPDAPGTGVVDNLVGLDDYAANGQLLADVVATAADPGGVLLYRHDDAVANAVEAGFRAELDAACPDCAVEVVPVPPGSVGVDLPGAIVADVQARPDVRSVVLAIGQMAIGVPEALEEAGLTGQVRLLTQAGGALNATYVAQGRQAADIAFPTGVLAYRLVDAAARALTGAPPAASWEQPFPRRILTPDTIADVDPAVGWRGPSGFEEQFRALWGV
jgi:ABC-type sugar transport system substrate-binding protein/actin-like ATPase involved in cell morphogenesis